MSRRVPLSRASKVVSELRKCHNEVGWGSMTPSVCSDDAMVDSAMLSVIKRMRSSGKDERGALDDCRSLSPADIVMVERWSHSPQVFDFNRDLADELARTDAADMPTGAVAGLPYPIQYVRSPMGEYDGFFAWTDRDFGSGDDVLVIMLIGRDSLGRVRITAPLSGTIGELAMSGEGDNDEVTVLCAEIPRYDGADVDEHLRRFADMMPRMLSMLLYICSDDPEVEVTYVPPKESRGRRYGKHTNIETIRTVGARIGLALNAARHRSVYGEGVGHGTTMPPHVRAAHWQHFWVGPRKGRTDGKPGDRCITHWIPPIAINGGGGDEVVHKVR